MQVLMNHREIEHRTGILWNKYQISEENIKDVFSKVQESQQILTLLTWLEDTSKDVFCQDLLLDYGKDCLRMYLMFENTPKTNDPYLDSWQECSLEGLYKFLGKYIRMVKTVNEANSSGFYADKDFQMSINRVQNVKCQCLELMAMKNTMPHRHNVIAHIMEELKRLYKELSIGQIVLAEHNQEIASAIPLSESGKAQTQAMDIHTDMQNDSVNILCHEIVSLMSPFAPYISEDLWCNVLGEKQSVFLEKWSSGKLELSDEKNVQIVVQVNSKNRRRLLISKDAEKQYVEECAIKLVEGYLYEKPQKCIYIPGKLINFILPAREE